MLQSLAAQTIVPGGVHFFISAAYHADNEFFDAICIHFTNLAAGLNHEPQ
jgi:hypothetical protein